MCQILKTSMQTKANLNRNFLIIVWFLKNYLQRVLVTRNNRVWFFIETFMWGVWSFTLNQLFARQVLACDRAIHLSDTFIILFWTCESRKQFSHLLFLLAWPSKTLISTIHHSSRGSVVDTTRVFCHWLGLRALRNNILSKFWLCVIDGVEVNRCFRPRDATIAHPLFVCWNSN